MSSPTGCIACSCLHVRKGEDVAALVMLGAVYCFGASAVAQSLCLVHRKAWDAVLPGARAKADDLLAKERS